ncbi:MAG: orotidine-5'-phosphate decarboxylase [Duodenibacillus sp.]|nr:orotidine-5'-phosphate decarboxylase [Duodenibacillus sp.]
MLFTDKLSDRTRAVDSMLCVGLDPDFARIPEHLKGEEDPVWAFCRAIVDATAPFVCAFKPQIAYFAAMGAEKTLERVIAYIHEKHPDIPVILDAKRGDIGSTARQYAKEAFVRYKADAVTVSPYMGYDTITPYLEYQDKGVIILCRTSNPGGADIEELVCDGEMIYERIARLASGPWNTTRQLGLVVGATQPAEIARVRKTAPSLPLLVPGIGAQGGDVNAAVAAGLDAAGAGMIINSSRAIIFAGKDENFAQAAADAARATRDAIRAAKVKALG